MEPEVDRISREIEQLELCWFQAHRTALEAEAELLADSGGETSGPRDAAVRLAQAERDKQTIMRRIEALEDALVQ